MNDSLRHALRRLLFAAATALACHAVSPAVAAQESGGGDEHLQREEAAVWQGVERLAERYREPWHAGTGQILAGGLLFWAGARQLAAYSSSSGSSGAFGGFPWFGLFFTASGSSSVAAGIHRIATTAPEADHARRLVESDLPPRAGLLYLRHRAQDARRDRVREGVTQLAAAAGSATYLFLVPIESGQRRTTILILGSTSAAITAGFGIYRLASRSLEEKLYEDLKDGGRSAGLHPRLRPTLRPEFGAGSDGGRPTLSGLRAGLNLEIRW